MEPVVRPIKRVHFVEYNAKVNTLSNTGMVFPKYGTPLLAAILRDRGLDARILLEDVSDMSFETITDCDAVCFPVYAPAITKIRKCAERIRRERPDLPIIMGGPHVNGALGAIFDVCDYEIPGEGDEVLPELLDCISRGADVRKVLGVRFRMGTESVWTGDRPPPAIPPTIPDLTLIEGIRRVRGIAGMRVVNALQTSRGCKFKCRFCPTSRLFGGVYRNRDIDSIIREIRAKRRDNPIFFVVDNSFLSNRPRTIELLRRMAQERLQAYFIVFERHDIGRDDELLALMWQAGVRCIIVGIESLVDKNLQFYDKRQQSLEVVRSVRNIMAHGIHVIGTFMLGGDGDTKESARDVVRFVRDTGVSMNLFIMHDVERDESKGLMIPLKRRFETYYKRTDPANYDYCDYQTGNFVTYFPKRIKPSTLQQCIVDNYREVYRHRDIVSRVWSRSSFTSIFGVLHGYSMRRLTKIIGAVVDSHYLDFLRQIEEGLYDENEVLQEDRLTSLLRLPIPRPLEHHVDAGTYKNLTRLLVLPGIARCGMTFLGAKLRRHTVVRR